MNTVVASRRMIMIKMKFDDDGDNGFRGIMMVKRNSKGFIFV